MIKLQYSFLQSAYSRFVNVYKTLAIAALLLLAHPTIKAQNNCLSFDGSNDYVNMGTISPTGNFSTGFTYMGWVKWGAFNSWSRLFDFGTGVGVNNILLANNYTSNTLTLSNYINTSVYQLTTGNIAPINQWVHIATTISNTGAAKIYVNGLVVASGNIQPPANIARNLCYLGRSNWGADAYFNGSMDEVSIWTRELTSTEINNSMLSSLAGNESGLYIYYNFNQGTAGGTNTTITTINDITSNAKNGTLSGFALTGVTSNFIESTVPQTIQNNCLSFDGSNDYVALPSLGSNLSQFTIETWFNANSFATSGNLNSIYNTNTWSSGDVHFQFINNSGILQVQLAVCGSTVQNVTYNFATNTWYHLAATYNATTKKINIYVDGSLVQSVSLTTAVNANFTAAQIGAWTTSRYFCGNYDDFRIWNTERTASEILNNMSNSLSGSETGLLACFKFNQGIAGGTNTNLTSVTNAIGTNHGTLVNFALTGTTSNWVSGIKTTPSNQVTNFAGSLVSYKMTLTWTDAIGGTTPDGYYIYASKTNSFTDPVDGVQPTIDNDLSDGVGVVKVLQGVQTCNGFIGDEPQTVYYFRIVPFSNPNNYIKFLTSGSVPTAQITSAPSFYQGSVTFPDNLGGQYTWGDYDNDGYLDLLEQYNSNERAELFRNNHNATFTSNGGFYPGDGTSIGNANWVDLDKNGYLDITGSYTTHLVYLNSGGSFALYSPSLWGVDNFDGDWADFNNDGNLDLVTQVGESNAVKVYQRSGNYFYEQFGSTIRNCSGIIKWIDYNNDGYSDIIAAGKNTIDGKLYTTIYKNDQNGRFIEQTQIKLPGIDASSISFADYNSDGKMDILIVGNDSNGNGVLMLLKNLNGTDFSVIIIANFDIYYQYQCFFADFNNDGLADILVGGNNWETGNISKLYKNNGDGTFSEIYSQTGTGLNSVVDLNNDGNLDFIDWNKRLFQNSSTAPNLCPNKITNASATLEGNGIRFQWSDTDDKTPSASLTYNLRIGTSSGSGNIVNAHAISTGALKLLKPGNMGTNTSVFFQLPKGTYYWNVQAIDNAFKGGPFMDADKTFTIVDVAASKLQGNILDDYSLKLKWNNGNGTRRAVFCKIGASGTASPVNGKTYVASSNFREGDQIGTSGWYCVYNGTSDSVIVNKLDISYSFIFHVVEYFGGNGSESYMTATGAGNPGVFSTASFSQQPNLPSVSCNGNGTAANFVDYNSDGFLDIAMYAKAPSDYHYFRIFKNKYDNTFEEQSITLPQYSYGTVSWADFNNDGKLDFVTMGDLDGGGSTMITKIYQNNGGVFDFKQDLDGLRDGFFSWCDYDNDGNIDLIVSGKHGVDNYPTHYTAPSFTRLYKNSGTPNYTFTEQTNISLLGLNNGSSMWGDYNNDGWPDLLIAGDADDGKYYVVLYENNKHGSFLSGITLLQLTNSYNNTSLEWSDLNKDGNLDFIWAAGSGQIGDTSGKAIIFYNNGDNTFTQDDTSLVLQKSWNSFGISDANNDCNPDIVFSGGYNFEHLFKNLYINDYPSKSFSIDQSFNFAYSNNGSVVWGDYDNDGDMDILAPGQHQESDGTDNVNIIRNNLITKTGIFLPNASLNPPSNIKTTLKPNQLIVEWDKSTSSPSPILSYNVMLTCVKPTEYMLNAPNSDTLTGRRLISTTGNAGYNNFVVFDNLTPGTYKIKVQSINGAYQGSSWSAPITVTVKNLQAFFEYSEVCRGYETQFTDQSTSSGSMTWLWKFDDDSTSTEQNPKHTFKTSGYHQVWLVVSSTDLQKDQGSIVKDSLLKTIYVKPRPKASYTAPNVCQGTETVFTNATDMDGIKAQSWKWDYGNGETSTDSIPLNKTFGVSKTYSTKLIVVATNDCADTAIVNTIVAPLPSATITISQNSKFSICNGSGDSADLSLTPQDNCSYQWENHSIGMTGKTDNTLSINGSYTEGTYSVTATVKNNLVLSGCQSTTTTPVVITISAQPVKPIIKASTNNFCPGTEVELKIDNYSSSFNYQWKRSGVDIDGANQEVYSGKLKEGDYSVEVEPGSCSSESDILTLTTKPAPPKPNLIAWGPTVWILVCDNTTAKDYRWYYNNDLIIGAKTNQYVARQNLGSYYVEVNDGGECYSSSDIKVIPDGSTGVADELFSDIINISPNPTKGDIKINLGNTLPGELKVEVVSSLGIIYKSFIVNDSFEFSTNINDLPSGLYYCKLYYKKSVVVKKIVKL